MFPANLFPPSFFPTGLFSSNLEIEIIPVLAGGGRIGLGRIGKTKLEIFPHETGRKVILKIEFEGEVYQQEINMSELSRISVSVLERLVETRVLNSKFKIRVLETKIEHKRFK